MTISKQTILTTIFLFFSVVYGNAQKKEIEKGCISGKCKNKTGTFVYEDGSKYVGEWKNSLRHGKGILYYENGKVKYEGAWINDKRNGYGIDKRYKGEWIDDKKNGTGITYSGVWEYKYKRYEGEWKNNKPHGKGKSYHSYERSSDGKWFFGLAFEGEWKNGRKLKGKYYRFDTKELKSYLLYDGEYQFENEYGSLNYGGFGILYDKLGGKLYEGEWKNGKKHGQGTFWYKNGNMYVGDFDNGLRHGSGKYIYKNGDVYEGEFTKDKYNGYGVYSWKNGNRYEGEYKNGKKHGKGIFYYNNGDKYDGNWKAGKREGTGKLSNGNKIIYNGLWEKDKRGYAQINYETLNFFEFEPYKEHLAADERNTFNVIKDWRTNTKHYFMPAFSRTFLHKNCLISVRKNGSYFMADLERKKLTYIGYQSQSIYTDIDEFLEKEYYY